MFSPLTSIKTCHPVNRVLAHLVTPLFSTIFGFRRPSCATRSLHHLWPVVWKLLTRQDLVTAFDELYWRRTTLVGNQCSRFSINPVTVFNFFTGLFICCLNMLAAFFGRHMLLSVAEFNTWVCIA